MPLTERERHSCYEVERPIQGLNDGFTRWRCGACGGIMGLMGDPEFCVSCGMKFEFLDRRNGEIG
jgi:hypothetical protein